MKIQVLRQLKHLARLHTNPDKKRDKQRIASEKLKAVEEAGDDAWEKVKATTDKVVDDLQAGIAHVVSYFK